MIKIFVVALKESSRKTKIKAALDALNIAFEFVDAVDARKELSPQYEKRVDRTLAKKRLFRPMSDQEFGCAFSHALVYEKIMAEKIAHSIILEDDAIIGEDFASIIKKDLLPNAPFDMGFLFHYRCYVTKRKYILGDYEYQKVAFMPYSTAAYYLNLAVAKRLQTATQIISYAADFPIAVEQKHLVVAFHPRLVRHPKPTERQSLISNQDHSETKPIKIKKNIGLRICYSANKAYYGSFWGFLKRMYFRGFYKNISPNV